MSKTITDLSEWPIVKVTFPLRIDVAYIDQMYDELEAVVSRGPHAHWTDLRRADPLRMPATIRSRAAERERRLIHMAATVVMADVRLVNGAVQRGILTAFEWLTGKAPWPVANLSGPTEAYLWLQQHGVTPDRITRAS